MNSFIQLLIKVNKWKRSIKVNGCTKEIINHPNLTRWSKRWFVLRQEKLMYYKNDKEYELLHYIPLPLIYSISEVNLDKRPFGLCITVLQPKPVSEGISSDTPVMSSNSNLSESFHARHHQRRVREATVYYLDAQSSKELEEWIAAFADALKNLPNVSILYWKHEFSVVHSEAEPPKDMPAVNSPLPIKVPGFSIKAVPSKLAIFVFVKDDLSDLLWWKNSMDEVFSEWHKLVSESVTVSAATSVKSPIATSPQPKVSTSGPQPHLEDILEVDEETTQDSVSKIDHLLEKIPVSNVVAPIEIPNKTLHLNPIQTAYTPFSDVSFLVSPFQTPLTESISQLSGYLLKMKHGKSLKRPKDLDTNFTGHYKFKPKDWEKRWVVVRGSSIMWYKDSKEYEVLNLVRFQDVAAILPHKDGFFIKEKYSSLSRARSDDSDNSSKKSNLSRAKKAVMKLIGKRDVRDLSLPRSIDGSHNSYSSSYRDDHQVDDENSEESDDEDELDDSRDLLETKPAEVCDFCKFAKEWAVICSQSPESAKLLNHVSNVPVGALYAMLKAYNEVVVMYINETNKVPDVSMVDEAWDLFWSKKIHDDLQLNKLPAKNDSGKEESTEEEDDVLDLVSAAHQRERSGGLNVLPRKGYGTKFYPIQIVTAKTSYYFACMSFEEMENWVVVLRKAFLQANIQSQEQSSYILTEN